MGNMTFKFESVGWGGAW